VAAAVVFSLNTVSLFFTRRPILLRMQQGQKERERALEFLVNADDRMQFLQTDSSTLTSLVFVV
jgi:hypothetical protein